MRSTRTLIAAVASHGDLNPVHAFSRVIQLVLHSLQSCRLTVLPTDRHRSSSLPATLREARGRAKSKGDLDERAINNVFCQLPARRERYFWLNPAANHVAFGKYWNHRALQQLSVIVGDAWLWIASLCDASTWCRHHACRGRKRLRLVNRNLWIQNRLSDCQRRQPQQMEGMLDIANPTFRPPPYMPRNSHHRLSKPTFKRTSGRKSCESGNYSPPASGNDFILINFS